MNKTLGFLPLKKKKMIKNKKQLISNGKTAKQRKVRREVCKILEQVLKGVDPYKLVQRNLKLKGNTLKVAGSLKLDLFQYQNIYVAGAGKAVYKMALAVEDLLRQQITGGCINIPALPANNKLKKITICKARHPVPDVHGVYGTKQIKRTLIKAGKKDLVLAVISGGGSSLMPLPVEGVTLKEKIKLTSLLLKTPATIHEINVVRKHLSQIKGGQFACLADPATLVTLYISDIVDDSFDTQASGPTAPDPSTFRDAIGILMKHGIWNKAPKSIKKHLEQGAQGIIPETPKAKHKAFCTGQIYNFTIGNHNTALQAAVRTGKKLGYHVVELTSALEGQAREVSQAILAVGKHVNRYGKPARKPALILASGETTVNVRGKGKGGRNQELVLSVIQQLQDGMTMASFGTDGIDGFTPIPVAGAIADFTTHEKALRRKLDVREFLVNNDSYHFFKPLRDHIHTGPSGTNVGDLIMLVVV